MKNLVEKILPAGWRGKSEKLSFERVTEILNYPVPGVNPMIIWQATREVGKVLQRGFQKGYW